MFVLYEWRQVMIDQSLTPLVACDYDYNIPVSWSINFMTVAFSTEEHQTWIFRVGESKITSGFHSRSFRRNFS